MASVGLATNTVPFAAGRARAAGEITYLLDLADGYVALSRQRDKKSSLLRGLTVINLFFENSTRTRTSFELAGKRLGAEG